MVQKIFCENCRTRVSFTETEVPMKTKVKGKVYEYTGKTAHCSVCGSDVYVPQICDYNLKKLQSEIDRTKQKKSA